MRGTRRVYLAIAGIHTHVPRHKIRAIAGVKYTLRTELSVHGNPPFLSKTPQQPIPKTAGLSPKSKHKRSSPGTFYAPAPSGSRPINRRRCPSSRRLGSGFWSASLASERARNGMESSSSGGGLARRRSSGGGGSSGRGSFDADPFDIPAKGAPLERLRKWRVSTLLHARRHLLSRAPSGGVMFELCTVWCVFVLVWAHCGWFWSSV